MVKRLFGLIGLLILGFPAWAGTCPSGSNYVSLSSPGSGGNAGSVTLASLGILQCYYISASGLDSNSGADETHPWLHAPGMTSFTGSHSTIAGDAFIFEGGGTWHYTSGSPGTSGSWTIPASGNGTNPIYYGIDPTWFSGGSFARPVLSMDNTLTTSFPSSCSAADDNSSFFVNWSSRTNVYIDGFEFTGACWNGNPSGAYVNVGTSGGVLRSYFHGWSATTNASDDTWRGVNGGGGTTNVYYYDVFDGSDSTAGAVCTTSSCVASVWSGSGTPSPIPATFWAMDDCATLAYSIFIHVSQGCQAGSIVLVHDNFFDFVFEPGYGRHGNVIETLSQSTGSFTAYNNITANVNEGENWNPAAPTMYIYNNIFVNDQHFPPDGNCLLLEPTGNNSFTVITVTFFQNTTDGTCAMTAHESTWASGSAITAENNQISGRTGIFTGSAFFNCNTGGPTPHNVCTTTTDNGGEIFSSTGGYTIANFWAPTSGTDSTVGKGNNLTSSCGTGGLTNDLCSGRGSVSEASSWGGFTATYPAITINSRPSSGAWDSGAYEFSSGGGPAIAPSCTPGSGSYSSSQSVSCTNPNSGTTVICYTTNGSTPATNGTGTGCTTGTQYSSAITVSSNETLKAIAGTSTLTDSSVASYTYTVQAARSTCTPGTGTYTSNQTPACTNPNSGTTVQCYTTNVLAPATNGSGTGCNNGTVLSSGGTISITANTIVKIIAGTSINTDSAISTYTYTLNGSTPTFSPVGGYPPQTVTISQAQSLSICYTLDGTTPTSGGTGSCTHGTLYSGAISVITIETISAVGIQTGWSDSPVGTATFSAGSTVGTGSGSGTFIIENSPTVSFPPTSGPDNYYCSNSSTPINGLNGTDANATGPQTCINTALANTPTPNGLYQHGGGPYSATSCADVNNILNGTGGFTQIAPGTILQVLPGSYTNCNISTSVAGNSTNWIQIESSQVANLPAEGTRITPCFKGVIWSSSTGMPSYPADGGCSTNYVASFATKTTSTNPALTLGTGASYLRFGPGLEFTRDGGAVAFAAQVTAATPGIFLRTCNGTNCTVQMGVGDGTTQGGIVSTLQSLSSNSSGINVIATTPITVQSTPQNNLTGYNGNYTVASVVDDTDLTYTQTYSQATLGTAGAITSITRTTGCLVTGAYSFTGTLPSPSIGLHVFVAGVTDSSFNMSSGSVALTAYSSTSSTTFTFGYTQAGGSCTASTSSGGELIDVDNPVITNCSSSSGSPIPNGNCNGVMGQEADLTTVIGGFSSGVNHIIFDRVLGSGDGGAGVVHWAETDGIFQLGDTDNIAIIDSYCEGGQSWKIIGLSDEGHCISGGVNNNLDSNAGTYKIVNNFLAASGETIIFGGAGQGFKVSQITVTSGSLVTGICVATCGIPSGTTSQFFAGSTLFPGGPLVNGVNGPQTVTCCTTTTHTNDTFTFPTAVTCSTACVDNRTATMTVGGYTPTSGEFRRNDIFKSLTWNPLDLSYDGGGPLPTGGVPRTVKNLWELKNYTNVLFEGNVGTNSWNTVDQFGSFMLITPKNQGGAAPGAQTQNVIVRYNRVNDINVALSISNALSDSGAPPYQGNTYSLHDNLFAQLGNLTLTCTWTYPPNSVPCHSSSPIQTAVLRSGGPGATSVTPNAILGSVDLVHNTIAGEVSVNYTGVLGGSGTQQSGAYGMVWKDSIFVNGISNIFPLGGTATGTVNVGSGGSCGASGVNVCWNSGTKFNCTTWGQGTTITIAGVGYTILTCNGVTNAETSLTLTTAAPNLTAAAYSVGTCFTPCTGASATCTCKLNSCWNNPVFDYNIIYDNSATGQTYPGAHTQLYNSATSIGFVNYNSAVPTTATNWGSQFALTSGSPGHNAADDGTDMGANITNVSGYTNGVDVFQ